MRLQAVRCTECGDARWSLFSTANADKPCELCGGDVTVERRVPGSGPRILPRERRTATVPAARRRAPLASR